MFVALQASDVEKLENTSFASVFGGDGNVPVSSQCSHACLTVVAALTENFATAAHPAFCGPGITLDCNTVSLCTMDCDTYSLCVTATVHTSVTCPTDGLLETVDGGI